MDTLPFKQKRLEVAIHIIVWLLIFAFPILLTEWGKQIDLGEYLRHSIVPLSCFVVFYVNYLYFIPKCLFTNKWCAFLLLNVLLSALVVLGLHYGHMQFVPPADNVHIPPPPHRFMFLGRNLIMLIFVIGLSMAIRISLRWRYTEERLVRAEREKTDAVLKNLRNQLNPHFLLNTLNNISALITIDSNKAQETVQELGKMLRYILYDNQAPLVPLEKELEFIENYISLMKIRLPKTVNVSVSLNPGEKPLQISPLIFISLIENAFKHGVSPTEPSFISISICGNEDGKVYCGILNSNFPKNENDKSGNGIGLMQVYRRLELSYSGKYKWNKGMTDDERIYRSILIIQTTES